MRVGVVGSRRRNSEVDKKLVFSLLQNYDGSSPLVVVSGGCKKGADRFAKEWCELTGVELVEHLPTGPKPACKIDAINQFMERNRKIANDCEVLIALVADDRKGGTESTIRYAVQAGVHVAIFDRLGRAIDWKEVPSYADASGA